MSRTRLQRALHVRVRDTGRGPTVDVRFYTQSLGVPLTSCIGTLRCSHQFFAEIMRPLIRKGAEAISLPLSFDVRPRGEKFAADDPTLAGPSPFPDVPRLGERHAPSVPPQPSTSP